MLAVLVFLAAVTPAAPVSTPVDVLVPFFIALIGASGSWLAYRQGTKRAYEVQNVQQTTALGGFNELTKHLQEQLNQANILIATLQERVDDCVRDRADLRTHMGVLQGKYEVLRMEFEQLKQVS